MPRSLPPSSALLLLLLTTTVSATADESRLLSDLFSGYDSRVRPVFNSSDPVVVSLGVTLQQLRLDPEQNEVTANMWISLEWTDARLPWDAEDYGNINNLHIPPGELWLPDIMPYNMLPRPERSWLGETLVVLKSDGSLLFVSPTSVRAGCRRDFSHGQDSFTCQMKFGSWTYNGWQVDLTSMSDTADLTSYVQADPFWTLDKAVLQRNIISYECCPDPYVDITLTIHLRRSPSLSAWPNLPVAVSILTSLAAFLVPVDSPQKLTLPCLSVIAAGSAVLTEFGLKGNAEYRAHFLRVYHVYTYMALTVLLWSVVMVVLGRPRALRLPSCLRRLLTSCLGSICCLASPPDGGDKLCHEWTALAEVLDRLAFVVYLVMVAAGSAPS